METIHNMHQKDRPLKVISIGTFNPDKPDHHPAIDEDQYYLASWGALWARRLKERYPDLDIEVWRPEPDFSEVSYRKAFDLVDCTIFPAKNVIFSRTVTLKMIRRLYKYRKKHDLVLHVNTIFFWKLNLIMPFFFPGARIILSHHGGVFPRGKSLKSRLKRKVLIHSYRNIHAVTYLRKEVKKLIGAANKNVRLTFLPVGADFNRFKPLDKTACRKKLNLPADKVFGVYVGKFYRLKGVEHILEACRTFNDRNFSVMFVGGGKEDELYAEVAGSGCPYWGHVDQKLLQEIYSAADFYIHPVFHPDFGGFDVVLMEALSCNIPVISPQLKELDFDYSELGLLLRDENDFLSKCELMITRFPEFSRCRNVAAAHLDGDTTIIDKLYKIFTD